MGHFRNLALGALAAMASLVAMDAAQASVNVTVWGGYNTPTSAANPAPNNPLGPDGAQDPNPTNAAVASFTWTGPIDWVNNEGNNGTNPTGNLFGSFFVGGTISGFSSTV